MASKLILDRPTKPSSIGVMLEKAQQDSMLISLINDKLTQVDRALMFHDLKDKEAKFTKEQLEKQEEVLWKERNRILNDSEYLNNLIKE